MTEITFHNVTDVYFNHQKNTDSGVWIEVEIETKDGNRITISLWSVTDKAIKFHGGQE